MTGLAPLNTFAALVLEVALNTIWQGSLIAVAVAGLLRLHPRASAATRYAVWTTVLLATVFLVLIPLVGAFQAYAGSAASPPASTVAEGHSIDEPTSSAGSTGRGSTSGETARAASAGMPAQHAPLLRLTLSPGWWPTALSLVVVLGSLGMFARIGYGVARLRRLASHSTPLGEGTEARLPGWSAARSTGRRARLRHSAEVSVPTLIGLGRPTIVIPTRLLPQLSETELDHVVLHELGHVRRWDDWTKLVQKLASGMLFFHPAVRFIERRMDVDREIACDQWVVARTGALRAYASCLLRLGELMVGALPTTLAPGAMGRSSQLSRRIETLVAEGPPSRPGLSWPLFWGLVVALALAVGWGTTAPTLAVSPLAPPTTQSRPRATASSTPNLPSLDDRLRTEVAAAIARDEVDAEDLDVRRLAVSALGGHAGSVIVMDPRSGQIHAAVNQDWCARRAFPPASMIKLVTAIAVLRDGSSEPVDTLARAPKDSASLRQPASMDLRDALAYSRTDFFQAAGQRVGLHHFLACARELGLGRRTGVNLSGEIAGIVPAPATADPTMLYGAGVGVEITPIQIAALVSAIANGGSIMVPRRVRGDIEPQPRGHVSLSGETRERLVEGMIAAVDHGTAVSARQTAELVAGKTATWEASNVSTGMFASFAPAAKPRVVVVVVTQGRDARGSTAAAIAGRVYEGLVGSRSVAWKG